MSYTYKKLTPSNIADLLVVYKDAFGKDVDLAYLNKKQNTSFTDLSYVGYIAYSENNEPAAFYGVFPCWAQYKGKKYLVAQSGDTMTHSGHTGKGLFTTLAKETYEFCRLNGIHLVFGFPNKNSYPGFTNKLGWSHFDDIHAYLVRVKCIPWLRLKSTFKLQQQLHDKWFRFVLSFYKKGKAFSSSCLQHDIPVIDHSQSFLEYKTYAENYVLNINGLKVWVKHDSTFLYIGDLENCSEKQFKSLLQKLKLLAFMTGLTHIRYHGSTNAWATIMFSKYGQKLEVTYPAGGVNFSQEVPLEKMQFTLADFDTF